MDERVLLTMGEGEVRYRKIGAGFLKRFVAPLFLLGFSASSASSHPSPRGLVEVDWPVPHVRRVLSAGYPDSLGLYAFPLRELPRARDVEGKRCVEASFFALDVDDDFAFDVDEVVSIELVLDRSTTDAFLFSYDRNGTAEPVTRVGVPKEGRDRFHREVLRLERARFANRGMSGTDVALVATGATFPAPEGESRTLTLCGVSVERSRATKRSPAPGRLELALIDAATSETTPARVGLYDATGRMPLPSAEALTVTSYEDAIRQMALRGNFGPPQSWPSANRWVFYANGRYGADVPAGTYDLFVAKGLEYRFARSKLSIDVGETTAIELRLSRWDDLASRGWYSGDAHIHIPRTAPDNERIASFLRAEDVHVSNLLEMTNPGASHFLQYAWGEKGQYRVGPHVLVSGIEGPRTAPRGHTISLNIRKPIDARERYFLYHEFFEEYSRQGGLSGYAHVGSGEFREDLGLALDAPFGLVDFVEVLQDGTLRTELWYELLNLGFQLTPMAGSDFPYFNQPGAERSYARVDGDFTPRAWFESARDGRTFVTSGPVLELTVNGEPMGSTLKLHRGEPVSVSASARINPDIDRLERIELVAHGEVVKSVAAGGEESLELRHSFRPERGLWLAVRAFGKAQAVSHSAPVYIHVGENGSWSAEKGPALVDRMLERLGTLAEAPVVPALELEFWEVGDDFTALWERQKPQLLERIEQARREYEALRRRFEISP